MFEVDLDKRSYPVNLNQTVSEGNVSSNRIGAYVYKDGQPYNLGGNCTGLVMRADGSTVPLTGVIDGNAAYVVLDQPSCAIPGPIQVAVSWVSGSNTTTLVVAYGTVIQTNTRAYIQPGTPIPDIDQLLAEIDNMREATAEAEAAADGALSNFAGAFSATTAYKAGQYVTYTDGKLYRFIIDHSAGAWDANHVAAITVGEVLTDNQVNINTKIVAEYESAGFAAIGLDSGCYRMAYRGDTITRLGKEAYDNGVTCKIPCTAGDTFTISGAGSAGLYRLYCFADANNVSLLLSGSSLPDGVRTVVAPANAAYLLVDIVLSTSSNPYVYKGQQIKYLKAETTKAEKDLAQTINRIHGIEPAIFQVGKHRNSTDGDPGIVEDDPAFMCARMDCQEGNTVTITGSGSSGLYRLACFYAADGTYITASAPDITGTHSYVAPENTGYVWINVLSNSPEIYAYKGNIGMSNIPEYYRAHLATKIAAITAREDTIGTNNDNFIFLSDYHWHGNSGNSMSLIKDVVENTGITKMFFGGDIGRSSTSKYEAAQTDARLYQMMWDSVPNFYGVLGNHEWNDRQDETHEAAQQTNTYSRQGVVNFYLRREQKLAEVMSAEGNYYVDNAGSKIRYFFIQTTGQARVTNTTCEWLIEQLKLVPDGYYVILVTHAAFDGWAHGDHEAYYGDRCRMSVIRLSQILGGYKTKTSGTVNQLADYYNASGSSPYVTGTIPFNFTAAHGTPICIIAGHMHMDRTLTESGIRIILTTTDAYNMNDDTEVTREEGTVTEQAFDVFQVDIDAGKIYATRIGGGSDREFTF